MIKHHLIFFCTALAMINCINAQSGQKMDLARYEGMASEKVFVSHNTSLLFAGEYLYYSVYCLDDMTKQPSNISTLAYVLLVAEDGAKIFEHKIGLKKSVGHGDFFVPTSVPSGNYKLIAYTKWMRNGSSDLFYQDDITILNPYRTDQSAFLEDGEETDEVARIIPRQTTQVENDKRFVIETDREVYSKRAKANIRIKNFRGPSGHGTYSLSVRRKSDFPSELQRLDAIRFISSHEKRTNDQYSKYYNILFLPEEIGKRIIGKVVPKDTSLSVADKMVVMSIPGEDFQLKAATTNEDGSFYIDVFENYSIPLAIFQLQESDRKQYNIQIRNDPPLMLENLSFINYKIDSTLKNAILKRSIHNQVENGFYELRPDTLQLGERNDPYWGGEVEHYELDEFTRFPTLLETMVEILPYASIRRDGPNDLAFNVRLFENYEGPQQNALVFIDGMLITDYNEIVEFDSKLIRSISVLRDKFELAGKRFRGMINIETLTKDYFDLAPGSQFVKLDIKPPKVHKKHFKQQYIQEKKEIDNRIPDYRHQLFWEPRIDFEGNEMTLEFFTSDVTGVYEITLEGFSIFGRPVLIRDSVVVE